MTEIKAGADLDVTILVKVFNFPRKKVFKAYEESGYYSYIPSGKPRRTHSIDARPVPWFSQSLDAAWTAADAFAERYGCTIRAERVSTVWERRTKQRYVATVQGGNIAYDRSDLALSVAGESPAHALCLVMLQSRVLTEEEMREFV